MLPKLTTLSVDELYVNVPEDGSVAYIGVNNGVIVDQQFCPGRAMVPKSTVRTIASLLNIPIILSIKSAYEMPVEVCSPQLLSGANTMREAVIRTRNGHRSLCQHHPLGYRLVEEKDLYSYGLVYNLLVKKFGLPEHKFGAEDIDMVVDQEYVENATEKHTMSEFFNQEHAVDFCSIIMDPRIHMGPEGKFRYYDLPRLLGFGSIELACQLTKKFTELHGTGPLPYDPKMLTQILQKVTGATYGKGVGHPIQLLGVKVLHGILNAPLDDLGLSLTDVGNTRLSRDAEVIRQRLFNLTNSWMAKLYGTEWTPDKYDPKEFETPQESDDV